MEVVNVVCKVASVEKISRNFLLRMLLLDRLRTSQIHEKNDDWNILTKSFENTQTLVAFHVNEILQEKYKII